MAMLHVCTVGTLSASLAAAALLLLLPLGDVRPPRTTSSWVAVAAAMAIPSAPLGLSEPPHQRAFAPSVIGRVLDPDGLPVAGMQVAMTGTKDVVESQSDGSFTFCTRDRGRCRVLAPPGWLAIESPLLDLCLSEQAPDLIVARSGRPQGRVCDPAGVPLASARVAVALHAKLPRQARLGPMPIAARGASIYGEWSGETDADGWYFLPPSPVGERAKLIVEHDGFETARLDLETSSGLRRVTLQPAATAGLNVASHGPSQPGVGIDGWLLDDEEQPRSGWWVAAVSDADADADADEGEGLGLWGRFAQAPVRVAADGFFAFGGLRAGSYHIEAWQPQNRAVVRSRSIVAPETQLRLCLEESRLPGRIRGRVLDANGMPIRGAMAGLGRPSGWAVPGHLGMQVQSIVTTDRDGNFEIATQGLVALELIVAGEAVVPQRLTLADRIGDQRLELRATPRRWLVMRRAVETPEHSVSTLMGSSLGATLTALDARDRALPMWLGGSPLVQPSCPLSGADTFGFPANSHSLVLRRGKREVARLYLRP